jgi:hypothetical protein
MRILQLIPMDNWYAVYNNDDGNGPIAKTVAFAALIEHEGIQSIVGYDGGLKFTAAENQANFLGYFHLKELEEMMVEEIDD